MADYTMAEYLGMLERSRLFASREVLSQCLKTWRELETTSDPEDLHGFADWLIQNKYLTQWQSENIFSGKYKGFFLGKYKLLRSIGAGGMSSVYLAVHTLLERQVAIKVLPKSRVTSDSSYLERFLLEAQAVAALDHPNIVRAYDVDTEGNSIYYLVMEYIDGPDLLSLVKKEGPLDWFRAAKYIRQAALGLQHAHEAGLIHRDMKPANLLVDKEDGIHVLDLGLARFTDEKRASLTLTYDENVLGTADYLAPEQARNSHNVDARADIYGLGCTLYYLLVGHVPFPEGTLAQRIAAHQKRMPARIQDERPEVPDSLIEICWKMMAKDPNDRQQTAEEVSDDLTRFLLENGQKVEGFTGTLASLQRKKEEEQEKKSDAIQTEALQDLNDLANLVNLAGGKTSESKTVGLDSLENSEGSKRSAYGSASHGKKGIGKTTFFSAFDQMKKMVENRLKPVSDDKVSEKSSVLSINSISKDKNSASEKAAAQEKDSSKVKVPDFSFGMSAIEVDIPEIPDFVLENTQDLKPEVESKSKAEAQTKEVEESEEAVIHLVRPESKTETESRVEAIHAESSDVKTKMEENPVAFLAQAGGPITDSQVSPDGSTHDFVLNFGASNSAGGSTVSHHGVLDSSVLKKGVSSANTQGSSVRLKKAGSSIAMSGKSSLEKSSAGKSKASKKPSFSKKKQEQLLYAYVALGFFVVLLIIAIISSFF